jgi:hypothetical protein
MGNLRLPAALAGLTAVCGLAMAPWAAAKEFTFGYSLQPGASCQLSLPASNPSARPKATGYRNESTTVSSFIICPIPLAVGNSWNGQPYLIEALVYSTDGNPHPVSCTAVVGALTDPDHPLHYSTKSETVDASDRAGGDSNTVGQLFTWAAADFGGGSDAYTPLPSEGLMPTVTCSLSPQVELQGVQAVLEQGA